VRGARGWFALAAIAVLVGAAAYFFQPRDSSPEHSSSSDAANGTSAVLLFAQAMGHRTDQLGVGFRTPDAFALMFVFTPTSPYTSDEASGVLQWVRSGGTLVYASEQGDPELDRALGVIRFGFDVPGAPYAVPPVLAGVQQVAGSGQLAPLQTSPAQVAILRTRDGFAGGYTERIGIGRVIVLADPLVLCNGYLERADNGAFLADVLGLAAPGTPVVFDEYHHGLTVSDFAPQSWVSTPWGAALLWLLVAVFFGLVLRGRRFGPLIDRPAEPGRSDAEWSAAVGQLLRRSSARSVTLGLLATATERAVAARTGLSVQPRERFWNALWVRAPGTAAELADVENGLQAAGAGQRSLLEAARRLHEIAYPPRPAKPR
jgi:Domain of unknown function (DUF4350)